MITAKQCKEVSIQVLNDIGILGQLSRIVADKGVNIRAAAAWAEDANRSVIRLITDDNVRASDALRDHRYSPKEVDSIEIQIHHSLGMLSTICSKLDEEDIGIEYLYTSTPPDEETSLVILSTSNNERALVALNE
jgi:hypothetical protein